MPRGNPGQPRANRTLRAWNSKGATCTRCGHFKTWQELCKQRRSPSGYRSVCRDCNAKMLREYHLNNRDRELRRYSERRHTQKYKSRQKLEQAVLCGKITRPKKCENCGRDCKPDAHHHDYSKPFEVKWLCRICHEDEHREFLEGK